MTDLCNIFSQRDSAISNSLSFVRMKRFRVRKDASYAKCAPRFAAAK